MRIETLKYIHKLLKQEKEAAKAGLEDAKEFDYKVTNDPDASEFDRENAVEIVERRTKELVKIRRILDDFENTDWR